MQRKSLPPAFSIEAAEGFPAAVSPMPPMGVLLNPQELADVMAYLMTLKG